MRRRKILFSLDGIKKNRHQQIQLWKNICRKKWEEVGERFSRILVPKLNIFSDQIETDRKGTKIFLDQKKRVFSEIRNRVEFEWNECDFEVF